jgi:hypothetical protein
MLKVYLKNKFIQKGHLTVCIYLIISLTMSACSDSSSGSDSAANLASVNAGEDQVVLEGQPITLDATVYPEGGTVVWVQIQGTFIDGFPTEDELLVEITAPTSPTSEDVDLVFKAEYTSLDGQVVYDEITIQVTNVDYNPIAIVQFEEGLIPAFDTYEIVTLSGSNSYDQDGEIRQYQWTQIDENDELTFISDTDEAELKLKAPFVTELTNFTLQLTVTDNSGLQGSNTLIVPVAASSSVIAANAGSDQIVDEFTLVTLDASDSASAVSDVTCSWQQTHGISTSISNAQSCIATFTAPDVDAEEELIFSVEVTDSQGEQVSSEVLITVNPVNLGYLHDTGITGCFSNSKKIACNDPDFPEQDADSGRDEISTLLDKIGDGPRSFDFTKFDENGDELSNSAVVFSCVRDNFTGLIWEVKEAPSIPEFENLRGAENYYSMDSDLAALSSCPSTSNCGQEEFITNVNDTVFCGGANWRLPTYLELLNVLDYNDVDNQNLLVSEFFTHTPDKTVLGNKFYWVSNASAEGGTDEVYFVLDLATGDDSAIKMSEPAYVILVRSVGEED